MQTRGWSLLAAVRVVGCKTPWKAARVRSSSLWVSSGRFDRASDSPCTTSRALTETGRQLLPALRVRPLAEVRGPGSRAEVGGSVRGCASPIVSISLRLGRCRWQHRQWSSASSKLGRVSSVSMSAPAQVSGGRRKVVVGRQPFAWSCDGEGGLRVAGVARGSRWGVSWQVIRGTDSAEVATSSGSSTG
jgi:hypothetical protein